MLKYTVKRVLLAVVTVFIIAAVTFFAMNAIPGGPFSTEKAPNPAVQAALEERDSATAMVYACELEGAIEHVYERQALTLENIL